MTTRTPKQQPTPGPYCDRFAALLPLLSANELAPEEASAVRAHLSDCPWCRRQIRDYGTVERALRQHLAALEASFPTFSAQEVITMVEHTNPTQSTPAPSQPARRPRLVRRFLTWVGPVAAVLLIILLAVSIFSVRGQPATSNQGTPTLYVSAGNGIAALRQSDGKLLWHLAVTSTSFTTPLSDHGIVYAIAGGVDGNYLIALRASDGKKLWQTDTLQGGLNPAFTAANGIVYLVTDVYRYSQLNRATDSAVLAYRGSDGKLLWRYTAQKQIASAPVVAHDVIYFGDGTLLVALNAQNGGMVWQEKLNLPDLPSHEWLAADNTSVYVYTDSPQPGALSSDDFSKTVAQVFALRASDGASLWQADLGADLQDNFLPPVISNNTLYVEVANLHPASDTDTAFLIYALQANTGKQLMALKEPGTSKLFFQQAFTNAFTYADDTLYYTKPDGSLDALHPGDNRLLWNHTLGVAATFLGTSDTAVFLLTRFSIQALSVSDGHLLWEQMLAHLK